MSILVLGGAGYIGSHAVYQLVDQNFRVVVIDNLQTGHREAVHPKANFYEGDIRDRVFMRSVFERETIDGILHFAANSLVGESMTEPLKYFDNNVYGTQIVLEMMKEFGVKHIVFSSTAAVYGEQMVMPITEAADKNPTNTYGETKLTMEKMMSWCEKAFDLKYVSLRYFNVAGARGDGQIGEDHNPETHLIPVVLEAALGKRPAVTVFGEDYDTEDGTCVRDYIHVEDLIAAHLLALKYLQNGGGSNVFNLGSNQGFSVKEIIETAKQVTGIEFSVVMGERRSGDPSTLIASSEKAKHVLGWNPSRTSIREIIRDAWNWHQHHPNGYQK
ncbi:UDP-glucose 4-epimerase GalE [Bacillus salipaludis]|uniref:UDP-glucose 4-epimerase n=1 Tax=Bacillus salipaludis TaxID=2547811 RepID=A0A4R5VKW8_9BACI|nr:UDP-glucose 4-epimerase GalE [Bacillus salipaludis]MDQ6595688.1 UDP-glucose 4-epimerase GalE [Bacillus salipaludis]TDK58633.1 UDP-glucose 4-epimerase GalE [Bacillus salipaludis]